MFNIFLDLRSKTSRGTVRKYSASITTTNPIRCLYEEIARNGNDHVPAVLMETYIVKCSSMESTGKVPFSDWYLQRAVIDTM